ncbi:hypothetical protein GH714_027514 [Hevea brasiliensis]|uniref:Uncharacterized protein n=1 Tax=Hevea brasiliensis TaxID=3981 RepID=A0A6A6MRK9_HEVBR|nr:hypothetical protein GH714_027514 [Hevea brasiliensis]
MKSWPLTVFCTCFCQVGLFASISEEEPVFVDDVPPQIISCSKDVTGENPKVHHFLKMPEMKNLQKLLLWELPCNLLKDRFRYVRYFSLSRDLGIVPDRLLLAKSKASRLIKFPNDSGIGPSKLFCLNQRFIRFWRPPVESGILPEK